MVHQNRRWVRLFPFFILICLSLTACSLLNRTSTLSIINNIVTINPSISIGQSRLELGATYTEHTFQGNPAAVAQGEKLLKSVAKYHNLHIMGFGSLNPNPAPGVYDWASLDERMKLVRDMGGIPVITLCCAPDWMKGGKAGQTDWSKLEVAPLPEHYADFAQLAKMVARRYPDVKYYQVWNEMKGFWDDSQNNWNYINYTNLYNQVYDALKSINRDIQVGGPYLVIEGTGSNSGDWWAQSPITERNNQVIDYWLEHMHGADFITLDRSVKDYHDTNSYSKAQLLDYTGSFQEIERQIQSKPKVQELKLPIWWAEDYFVSDNDWDFQAVGLASILYNHVMGGAAVSLRWQPEGVADGDYRGNDQSLFSDSRTAGGAQPFPNYNVYKLFHDYFGAGTPLVAAASSSPEIEALATPAKTLLINKADTAQWIGVNGVPMILDRYSVKIIDTPPFVSLEATSTTAPPKN